MYKKNLALALLETTSKLSAGTTSSNSAMTPRLIQLGLFLEQYFDRLSVFDDVKDYVADLSIEEAKALVEVVLPNMLAAVSYHIPGKGCPRLTGTGAGRSQKSRPGLTSLQI